ncbi:hypothetical protein GM415_01715 [Pseudodesulfovibrio cashew]|uniref:Uncharacterized protein n=1 Tax=Pseudodesulfovibrio cashew TaxID=2678688 RepID=A0A6I6J7U6_9BACT|nr:hypothetical protein [Pseudodesulfovibrio cashew]QGY38906.1 hypothetical protein GM415_01715 [Pseudodesulfovibrio cashew]
MAKPAKRKEPNVALGVALSLILLAAVGAVVFFQTDLLRGTGHRYDDALLNSVQVSGTIKARDLHLTGREITKINNLARRYGNLFHKMDINLVLPDKFSPIEIEERTTMVLTLRCHAEKAVVEFWSRRVSRSDLVRHVTRSMAEAASEYEHFIATPGSGRSVAHLYL